MTIRLDLPPEVESTLTREAQRQGTTPENLLLGDIQRLYSSPITEADQAQRQAILGAIIARAHTITLTPPDEEEDDPAAEIIADKFRRQGFHL